MCLPFAAIVADAVWWTTRPTRDLRDIPDSLRAFARIAEGKKWAGNRDLHQRFEVENPAKTSHAGERGSNGGGGRTWAAWLRSWGMWYDGGNVTLTDAARLILAAKSPADVHKQIVHMIMTFQITSPYHEGLRRKDYSGFRVFPFRLMLEMLLDRRVGRLSVDEIALFLLPVRSHSEYEGAVSGIEAWRKESEGADPGEKSRMLMRRAEEHMERHHEGRADSPGTVEGYWRSARDVAHTFASNIAYITEIRYGRGEGISVPGADAKAARRLLEKYAGAGFSTLHRFSEAAFAERYGMRFDRRKASGKDTRPRTAAQKRRARISAAIDDARRGAGNPAGDALLEAVGARTGYRREVIEEAMGADPGMADPGGDGGLGHLESHYLRCARDGSEHAEFEEVTRKMFESMGFIVRKERAARRGGGTAEVDGLVLSTEAGMSGILECKGRKVLVPRGGLREDEARVHRQVQDEGNRRQEVRPGLFRLRRRHGRRRDVQLRGDRRGDRGARLGRARARPAPPARRGRRRAAEPHGRVAHAQVQPAHHAAGH